MKKLLLLSILLPISFAQVNNAMGIDKVTRFFSLGAEHAFLKSTALASVGAEDEAATTGWFSGTAAKAGLGIGGALVLGYAGYKLYNKFFGASTPAEPVVEVQVAIEEPVVQEQRAPEEQNVQGAANKVNVFIKSVLNTLPNDTRLWKNEQIERCVNGLATILSTNADFYGNAQAIDEDVAITLSQLKNTLEVILDPDNDKVLCDLMEDKWGKGDIVNINAVYKPLARALITHLQEQLELA